MFIIKSNNKIKIHIIPSTHWDREWYLPFRRYQPRLVRLFDKVLTLLARNEYPNFMMDGQWCLLDDYLEIKPEQESLISTLIKEDRLTFGPWYVVPDTLIVSGESLVRNLQIGMEFTQKYGRQLTTGYSPDSFGLAAQIPQIYSLFGFQNAMFTRGQRLESDDPSLEMRWQSPDGTDMPALAFGYSYGASLTVHNLWLNIDRLETDIETAVEKAKFHLEMENKSTKLTNRLWICGIDHLEPKEHLRKTIESLNPYFTDAEFVFSDMDSYFREFSKEVGKREVPVSIGEQRGDYSKHFILGNVQSTRMDLKMKNRETENKLAYVSMPLAALNQPTEAFGMLDSKHIGDFAWKLLVQNHSHDAICCCSSDATMRDIENKIDNSMQLAREIEKEELKRLGSLVRPCGSTGALMIYNPLPFTRSHTIKTGVVIPYDLDGLVLTDEKGQPVDGAVIKQVFRKRIDIESMKTNEFSELAADTTRYPLGGEGPDDIYTGLDVEFDAIDIPACGYRCYFFKEGDSPVFISNQKGVELTDANKLENLYVRITVNEDGTLNILDKTTGQFAQNTHFFEIQGDDGDTYTFSPSGEILTTLGKKADSIIYTNNEIEIQQNILYRNEAIRFRTIINIDTTSSTVMVKTIVNNEAKNVRIRAIFDYDGEAKTSMGNTAFDLTQRPVFESKDMEPSDILTMPMRDLLLLPFDNIKQAVFSRSVQEYEAVRNEGRTLAALTLLRAVDKVYSTHTLTKDETSCGDGVRWWTKDALMQGEFVLCYALKTYPMTATKTQIMNDALDFSIPLVAHGILAEGINDPVMSRCEINNAVLSTIDTDSNDLIIRIYNPDDQSTTASIRMAQKVSKAALCDLRGIIIKSLTVGADNTIFSEIGAHQIQTIRIS